MPRYPVALILATLAAAPAVAQDTAAPTAPPAPWRHRLVGGLTATQVQLKDWSQGGEDALAWGLTVDGESTYEGGKHRIANAYKLAFGQTKLGSGGIRKTDDRIDLQSTYTYKVGLPVNPYVAASLKTQFARGYVYEPVRVPISGFFDPGYLTQSAGVGYEPRTDVRTRLGLGLREVFTRDYPRYADDPETATIEKTSVDGGLESVTSGEWQLRDNLRLTSKLEIFAPFTDLGGTVLHNDNRLSVKVSEYVNVNLNLEVVQDDKASKNVQVKQVLALGLTYNFI
ncbi:MAG: DUF3078 domain-containing protein [Gemmatimonadota bacterium]